MIRFYHRIRDKKGNVTVMWVAGLPAFIIILMFMGTLATAWMAHSASQVAADASSLAATEKLDIWVKEDLARRLQQVAERNRYSEHYVDPYYEVLGTKRKRQQFITSVIRNHEQELKATVREYAVKNGGDRHGVITLSVHDRVEVTARKPFKPMLFKEEFKHTYIKGSGTGPTRHYLEWLPERAIKIHY